MKPLNEKQAKFVTEYVTNGFNAKAAALKSGYSPLTALTDSHSITQGQAVKPRIEKAQEIINEEFAKHLAITMADKAKVLAQIIYDIIPQDGSPPNRRLYDQAMKAIDILNKMQGHYMPDRSIQVNVNATKERLLEAKRKYKEF